MCSFHAIYHGGRTHVTSCHNASPFMFLAVGLIDTTITYKMGRWGGGGGRKKTALPFGVPQWVVFMLHLQDTRRQFSWERDASSRRIDAKLLLLCFCFMVPLSVPEPSHCIKSLWGMRSPVSHAVPCLVVGFFWREAMVDFGRGPQNGEATVICDTVKHCVESCVKTRRRTLNDGWYILGSENTQRVKVPAVTTIP